MIVKGSARDVVLQMPLLVPCPVTRRSSPAEDYMATLSGVSSLIDQQQQLLRMFQSSSNTSNNTTTTTTNNNKSNNNNSSKSNNKTVSDEKVAETAGEDLAASSSSSMQTLRRIMEIEELRKFSDILESKLEGKHIK